MYEDGRGLHTLDAGGVISQHVSKLNNAVNNYC